MDDFESMVVAPVVVFRYLSEPKWKNLSVRVFCKIPVIESKITSLALVPRLAMRGTYQLPSIRDIAQFLETMYGSCLGANSSKVGPIQVVNFKLEIPSPIYLSTMKSGEPLGSIVGKAWSFLWDVVNRPYLEDDAYPEKVFSVDKEEHRQDILGLINNPSSYALVRLIEEISQGDPRGLPPWGSLDDLNYIDSRSTWAAWKEALSMCPISIYAVGEGADLLGEIISKQELVFPTRRGDRIWDISENLEPLSLPEEGIRVEEGFPGQQTVLCMAFHTGVTQSDAEFPTFLFLDGLLGGFPHSKLFSVVREEHGLAYFADTVIDTWRGFTIAITGISDGEKDRVEDLVVEQFDAIRKGRISDEEMANTRAGLRRRLMAEADYQGSIVNRRLNHEILGGAQTGEEVAERILEVTRQDVVDLANETELKCVYVLRAEGAN